MGSIEGEAVTYRAKIRLADCRVGIGFGCHLGLGFVQRCAWSRDLVLQELPIHVTYK